MGPRTSQHSGPNAAVLAPPTSSAWPERIYLDNPARISSALGCFGSKCLESMHYRMSWCAVPEAEREDYFFCLSCIMMSQLWKNDSGYIKRRPSQPSVRSSLANPQPYQILSVPRCRWWSNSHVLVCSIQDAGLRRCSAGLEVVLRPGQDGMWWQSGTVLRLA